MRYSNPFVITQSNLIKTFSRLDDFFDPRRFFRVDAYYSNDPDTLNGHHVPAKYGSYELFIPNKLIIGPLPNIILEANLFFKNKNYEKFSFAINPGSILIDRRKIIYVREATKYLGYTDNKGNCYKDKIWKFSLLESRDIDYYKDQGFKIYKNVVDKLYSVIDDVEDEEDDED